MINSKGWGNLLNPLLEDSSPSWLPLLKADTAPSRENVFRAYDLTDLGQVKCVIWGQDPYHTPGVANGLAFAVNADQKLPPSLNNMYKEAYTDLGKPLTDRTLVSWAKQGVLLLNTSLTVTLGQAGSHKGAWDFLIKPTIEALVNSDRPIVYILLGAHAQAVLKDVKVKEHQHVIRAAHPSPLSAYNGFFGSRIYSRANAALTERGVAGVDWCNGDPVGSGG
jgi:uracil-DNA glycosylase